jgi:hypothetical protein
MSLVNIVVVLVVTGLIMWLINTYIPMASAIKSLAEYRGFRGGAGLGPSNIWHHRPHTRRYDAAPSVISDRRRL